MSDENKQSDQSDDQSVRRPDPLAAAKADPGKKVPDHTDEEESPAEGIIHLDRKNSLEMIWLDELKARAREINEEIQSELNEDIESASSGSTTPLGVSPKLIEINTLTLTYFEGVAFQFLKWGWEADHELVDVIREDCYADLPWNERPSGWDEETVKTFSNGTSPRSLIKSFVEVDFLETGVSSLHDVKSHRNNYVHNPRQALDLNAHEMKEVLTDCLDALDGIEMMVEEYLPLDDDIYEKMSSDK